MSDNNKDAEKKPKKNPAPTARSVKRRKKKGPANAVKIPQSRESVYESLNNDHLYSPFVVISFSDDQMQATTLEVGEDKGLLVDGGGVYSKSRVSATSS